MSFLRWVTGILLGLSLPLAALADPPSRVARLAWSDGQVYLRLAGETATHRIRNNWSLTAGQVLQTERFARAELRVGSSIFRLDAESELEILRLDDERIQLRLNSGTLLAQVQHASLLAEITLDTPHGRLVWQEAGKLRLHIGHRPERATLAVFDGSAQFEGKSAKIQVRAGHQVEFYRDDVNTSLASRSDFDQWAEARDQLYASNETLRYLGSEYTGYEELERHGNWRPSSPYGAVWLPHDSNFMPFKEGEWTWLAPWGWTWVDHKPWAYVTSHYGRWVWLEQRWAWVPGQLERRPVWSPALVGWAEAGQPVASPAFSQETSWFPLGPREIWWPAYTTAYGISISQNYLYRVNRYHLPPGHRGNLVYGQRYQYYDRHYRHQKSHFVHRPTMDSGRYPRPNLHEHRQVHPAPPVGGRIGVSTGTVSSSAVVAAPVAPAAVAPASPAWPRHDPARYEGSNEDGNNGRFHSRREEVRQNTPRAVVPRYEGSNEDGNNGRYDARPDTRQRHESRTENRRASQPAPTAATASSASSALPVFAVPAAAPAAASRAASDAPNSNAAARAARAEEQERRRDPNNRQAPR